MRAYRDLKAWQHAIDLAPEVYKLVRRLPKEENFALSNQIRRAVVSIAANIAEGQSRQHKKEFIQFLFIAKGSLAELETLLIFAEKLSYLQPADLEQIEPRIRELRMTLLRSLLQNSRASSPFWIGSSILNRPWCFAIQSSLGSRIVITSEAKILASRHAATKP